MGTVGEVRGEESALFVFRIPDGRPERNGILLEPVGGGWHDSLHGFFSSLCTGRIDVDRTGNRDPVRFSLHPERNLVLKTKV